MGGGNVIKILHSIEKKKNFAEDKSHVNDAGSKEGRLVKFNIPLFHDFGDHM